MSHMIGIRRGSAWILSLLFAELEFTVRSRSFKTKLRKHCTLLHISNLLGTKSQENSFLGGVECSGVSLRHREK